MTTPTQEVSDEAIKKAWGYANFGYDNTQEFRRKYLLNAVMKKAMGYHNGHTIDSIIKELGLVNKADLPNAKGRRFLRELYEDLEYKP